ncbi:hypothetical protein [Myceligenerans salitolerans]|uniref:GlcNAc-PI de-N-acetylase n=1 Tax=Myceligenerans salitolerans TaxID=1230528 RepID=A0ABS3IEH6_9MICO|nr:hypothetical protein [Myceligenerans salitolerans]MBO0611041.1 hypothetical protein [Myceligenerans salitolerans]
MTVPAVPGRTPSRRSARLLGWIVFLSVVALACVGAVRVSAATDVAAQRVLYSLVPHPDDEFEFWSLVEDDPKTFPVFLVLTRGEQTSFCGRAFEKGWQPDLEPKPSVRPTGRWTQECRTARVDALLRYMQHMSSQDPTIPGDFEAPRTVGPFPDKDGVTCRVSSPDRSGQCEGARSAKVWEDRQDRGNVVFFDLGDGDLTADEVGWALRTVRRHPEAFGIDPAMPEAGAVGAFANEHGGCFSYPHPDHVAVHRALATESFGLPFQAAATCADSAADTVVRRAVSREAATNAFGVGPDDTRTGAHTGSYGWLHDSYYPLDPEGQDELFTRVQWFWVRYTP